MEIPLSKDVFGIYAFSIALLIIKTCAMSLLTARQRFKHGIFISPEDVKGSKEKKVGTHPSVDRVRNAHLNDLENILTFCILAPVYLVAVQPTLFTAKCVLYGFTAARYFHTFTYLNEIPQPSRALAFFTGLGITFYMAYQIIVN